MIEIIPAINAETFDEVVKKIRLVEPFADWAHIDIADGTFTQNSLWHNPLDLVGFETKLNLEIHLMEEDPEERFATWLFPSVKRIIVQQEATHDFDFIANICHSHKREAGISVLTETNWSVLKPFLGKADLIQFLAVHPGFAGQKFDEHNYYKIKKLRALDAHIPIEVDGGVKVGVAKKCASAGATHLVVASAIFDAVDVEKAIEELKNDVV
jgi:ribulose-phosphate 3-epimerase